jgi:small-conductance mechanosensitive channel
MKRFLSERIGSRPADIFELLMIVLLVLIMAFSLLHVFNVDTNTLLLSGGIISLTAGLVVSTFVGDTLAGMLVLLLNMYRVGDTVLVNNIPSRVAQMSAFVTRFRNDAGGVISIPNTAISQGGVVITRFPQLEDRVSLNMLPYSVGDRVFTTFLNAEGVVVSLDPIHTRIRLDSGRELLFLNNSVLSGSVAVARIAINKVKGE